MAMQVPQMLPTTSVGSFPKPDYLTKARTKARRGQMDPDEMRELEQQATREVIQLQEDLGIDVIVDGEMYRGDMAEYFAEHMSGFTISGLVRSYGNRYYHKPIVTGAIERPNAITVEWWKYAQSLTEKPVKGMLTGPYTMMDWSFVEYYPNRRECTLALARAIHDEVVDLEKAGATIIQVDEPALSARTDEVDLAIEAMGIVTQGVSAKIVTHICYGTFDKIYPKMLDLPLDQIDLEFANSKYRLLDHFERHPFTKEVGYGVVDIHSHRIETVEEIVAGIRRGLEYIPPEKLYVDPDCGLKTRTWEESKAKLTNIVAAVKQVRAELGAK